MQAVFVARNLSTNRGHSSTPTLFVTRKSSPISACSLRGSTISFSVIGLSDGLTVPFALAAGLSSLGESKIVVLGGVAELFAGAISMGIGGFLASQAERDHYRYLQHHTAQRVHHSCAGEMEREVTEVLAPIGVDEKTCQAVAQSLREVEGEDGFLSDTSTDDENAKLRWSKEVGLTAFLLKFGQGMGKPGAFF